MRLCNADVDEAERNCAQFEDFDELNEDAEGGESPNSVEILQVDLLGLSRRDPSPSSLDCHVHISSFQGSSKSFFDLRQRTLSGMDLMPAFRVVVLGLSRKLKNNTKDQHQDKQPDSMRQPLRRFCQSFAEAKTSKLDKD
eukprot:Skav236497  [mRNA]  locus=scaffold1440:346343:346762:+ [translate_table: standard]